MRGKNARDFMQPDWLASELLAIPWLVIL